MPRKRKLPDGLRLRGNVYYADFCANGRRVRKRLSTNLDAAEQLLRELQVRADRADFGILDNDYPLAELRTEYLRHCKQALRASTVESYEICLGNVLSRLPGKSVRQVDVNQALLYREGRLAEGISPGRINMETGALSTMLTWAAAHKLTASNPLADLAPLPHDRAKEGRALTDDEVRRLLEASPPHWRDIWYAYLVTGLRMTELTSLRFEDIDWQAREIVVRQSVAKSHRERRIPIEAGLWDILQKQRAERDRRRPGTGQNHRLTERIRARFTRDHVFVSTKNTPLDNRSTLYHVFVRYCKKAGIEVRSADAAGKVVECINVHSTRRTFATNLIVGGADPKTVQELLGHRTLEMTMAIYAKVNPQNKRQALGRLSYGGGALVPEGVVDYPGPRVIPVQKSPKSVTEGEAAAG